MAKAVERRKQDESGTHYPHSISKQDVLAHYDYTNRAYRLIVHSSSLYSRHFGIWDHSVKTFEQSILRTIQVVASLANIHSSDRVLDAGCGLGGSSIWLAKNIGCDVVGITISEKEVIQAQENAKMNGIDGKAKFLLRDYTRTEFPAETFDVVWAIESVCHCSKKRDFLREAFRILKKDGRLIVADGFLSTVVFNPREKFLVDNFMNGLAIVDLATVEGFHENMEEEGFSNIHTFDKTREITRFARRLFLLSWMLYPLFILITPWLMLRYSMKVVNINRGTMSSMICLYPTLIKRLTGYFIFYGEKQSSRQS